VRALGSIAQLGKQTVSIGIKAAVNHLGTGSLGSFVSGITQYREASQLFDHYSIGARENRLGGVDRGTSKHFTLEGAEKSFYKGLDHVRKFSDKVGRKSLWFLTKADTYAAKTTWLGYYLQSLQEQGVSKADVSQEHTLQHDPRRQQAAAYAETMVGETQVPSNPATLAQISRNDAGAGWNIAKNIMLPFSTYNINAKYRYIQNMSRMLSNFNKETSAAVAGDLAEVASYIAMTSGVVALLWKPMLKGIIEKITGSEPPDRDEERIERNRDKGIISLAINQISPTSIGPGELVTAIAANRLTYIYNQVKNGEEKTYGEWKRETGGLVYDQDEFDYGLISLGFEPYSEAISNGVDQVNIWQGKPITYEPFAGVESKAESNDQIQAVLALKALMDAGQMIGLTEADLYREVVKVYKEQLRESTKNSKKPKPRRGRVRF
jgi:hypothetical protein